MMVVRIAGFLALVSLLCAGAAHADETFSPVAMDVSQLLKKIDAAKGTDDAAALHIVARVDADGTTTNVDTVERGDEYVTVMRDGPYTTSAGTAKNVDWWTDENGVVYTAASDAELARNPYSIAINNAEAVPDAVRVLGTQADEPHDLVLEIHPRSGLLQRRYYDPSTYLLHRLEVTEFRGKRVTVYDDYRHVYGRTVAFHSTSTDSHNKGAIERHILSIEPRDAKSLSFSVPESATVFDLGGAKSLAIPAEFTPSGIIVRVTIAGRGLDFQLDSGAADSVIDEGVARQLGMDLHGSRRRAFGGDFTQSKTRAADFRLGSIQAHDFALAAIPFSQQLGDKKIVGLLGGDFFSAARIRVDFTSSRILMEAPGSPVPSDFVKVPVDTDDMVPIAHVKFNGVDGRFVVDLGADITLLYNHYFAKFKPTGRGPVLGELEGIGGKAVDFRDYMFSRLDLGEMSFADIHAAVIDNDSLEGVEEDGLLGRMFLSNFDVLFDYADGALFFKQR